MNYIGIDLSLTGTGVVVIDDTEKIVEENLIKTTPKEQIEERLNNIINKVVDICNKYSDSRIYMEGLSFGSKGQSMLELGALHYMLRCNFFSKKIKFLVVPPTTLKKFICGKGVAKKELMLSQ